MVTPKWRWAHRSLGELHRDSSMNSPIEGTQWQTKVAQQKRWSGMQFQFEFQFSTPNNHGEQLLQSWKWYWLLRECRRDPSMIDAIEGTLCYTKAKNKNFHLRSVTSLNLNSQVPVVVKNDQKQVGKQKPIFSWFSTWFSTCFSKKNMKLVLKGFPIKSWPSGSYLIWWFLQDYQSVFDDFFLEKILRFYSTTSACF